MNANVKTDAAANFMQKWLEAVREMAYNRFMRTERACVAFRIIERRAGEEP